MVDPLVCPCSNGYRWNSQNLMCLIDCSTMQYSVGYEDNSNAICKCRSAYRFDKIVGQCIAKYSVASAAAIAIPIAIPLGILTLVGLGLLLSSCLMAAAPVPVPVPIPMPMPVSTMAAPTPISMAQPVAKPLVQISNPMNNMSTVPMTRLISNPALGPSLGSVQRLLPNTSPIPMPPILPSYRI